MQPISSQSTSLTFNYNSYISCDSWSRTNNSTTIKWHPQSFDCICWHCNMCSIQVVASPTNNIHFSYQLSINIINIVLNTLIIINILIILLIISEKSSRKEINCINWTDIYCHRQRIYSVQRIERDERTSIYRLRKDNQTLPLEIDIELFQNQSKSIKIDRNQWDYKWLQLFLKHTFRAIQNIELLIIFKEKQIN